MSRNFRLISPLLLIERRIMEKLQSGLISPRIKMAFHHSFKVIESRKPLFAGMETLHFSKKVFGQFHLKFTLCINTHLDSIKTDLDILFHPRCLHATGHDDVLSLAGLFNVDDCCIGRHCFLVVVRGWLVPSFPLYFVCSVGLLFSCTQE